MAVPTSSKQWIKIQVGVFLVVGVVLFMMAIFLLSSKSSFFSDEYQLYCHFDDISGLRVGSPVQLAGVSIGTVEGIDFVEVETNYSQQVSSEDKNKSKENTEKKNVKIQVRVLLNLDKAYQKRIRDDSVASVLTQGVLGDRMIYITAGTSPNILQNGDEITDVRNPTGFTTLVDRGDLLLMDAQKLIGNLNHILEQVKSGDGMAHQLIYNESGRENFRDLEKTLDNLTRTSHNFFSISKKIDDGQGTLGGLINDPSVFNDVKEIMGKASRSKLLKAVIRYTLREREKEQLKAQGGRAKMDEGR